MWPKITRNYSPNFSLPKRSAKKIKFIIIHYTGMKNENSAFKRLCSLSSKVSAHYFIKKNGEIINLVPDLYEAWHAGISKWKKFKSLNQYSIGIEIHNSGHDHKYENFSIKEISSLIKLLKYLLKKYQINTSNILGHSDVAPNRKKDPGEKFPWKYLYRNNLGFWHDLDEKSIKKLRLLRLNQKEENIFFKDLFKIGYASVKNYKLYYKNKFLVKAFQRRFRQSLVNGIPDKECFLISKSLLKER